MGVLLWLQTRPRSQFQCDYRGHTGEGRQRPKQNQTAGPIGAAAPSRLADRRVRERNISLRSRDSARFVLDGGLHFFSLLSLIFVAVTALALGFLFRFDPSYALLFDAIQPARQMVCIGVKTCMRDFDSLSLRKTLQLFRQFFRARHFRAIDENRNHANAALQRGCDFNTDKILGVVEPPRSRFIDNARPMPTNYRHQGVAVPNSFGKDGLKIEAGLNVVDIEKYARSIYSIDNTIVDQPRKAGGVFASITDKNSA